ncbi:MAG TPA: 50S ribosomal protein L29 [Terriglobales bacterium]|jgi:large subunit ribosomal protein L29|nr:50S ribosomal protein L29 [Terriglobales bacterium]
MSKRAEKFRQMSETELKAQEQDLRDQVFRLKFQMAMGNAESLKKLQQLRRDVARVKTMLAERRRAEGR